MHNSRQPCFGCLASGGVGYARAGCGGAIEECTPRRGGGRGGAAAYERGEPPAAGRDRYRNPAGVGRPGGGRTYVDGPGAEALEERARTQREAPA